MGYGCAVHSGVQKGRNSPAGEKDATARPVPAMWPYMYIHSSSIALAVL